MVVRLVRLCGVLAAVAAVLLPTAVAAAPATPVPAPPPVVLPAIAVTGSTAPAPTTAQLAARLAPLLRSPALGGRAALSVVDPATGQEVYDSFGGRPQHPASTLKLLTAVTALRILGPQTRLATRVVRTGPGVIVLVGGGDQTLTRSPTRELTEGQPAAPASLDALAAATGAALRAAGQAKVALRYDDSLFTGPATAPGWPAGYVASGVVSPVSALAADAGRTAAGALGRSPDPAVAAAAYFASRLRAAGITVSGKLSGTTAPASAAPVASVQSPPVADLVERMLTVSDDDLAEGLAHLAGAAHGDGSFAGGAEATLATVRALGIDTDGAVVRDGSGLSLQDELPAGLVASLLAAVATPSPATAAYGSLFSGLPVAGLTGTLAYRFTGPAAAGRGVVRAKTGTLTGVVALAGSVPDAAGRLLTFAVLADRVVDRDSARTQVDRIAAALATS